MYHFKPGSKNLISDVQGLLVGNAEDHIVNTGTTVLTGKKPFTSSYKVLGGAPGSRETDLLEPDKLVKKITNTTNSACVINFSLPSNLDNIDHIGFNPREL